MLHRVHELKNTDLPLVMLLSTTDMCEQFHAEIADGPFSNLKFLIVILLQFRMLINGGTLFICPDESFSPYKGIEIE
jgi:hypothetical protein